MKFAMIIPDGMGDFPVAELGGKTPVEAAHTPNLDALTAAGQIGLCRTVPEGFYPGSDICILSLLGYNPAEFYSGRAPLEAASLGIPLKPDDLVMRLNLINLSSEGNIKDHCAGHITTPESQEIIQTLKSELETDILKIYPGVSYRHIAVWKAKTNFEAETTPPHDVPGEPYANHLPKGRDSGFLKELIDKSRGILKGHPVNRKRREEGKPSADSIWLWGCGYSPKLEIFSDKFKMSGAVISAVDLIKGLGVLMKLKDMKVPGITAYFDTDYRAKGRYAIEALKEHDFVLVHVEAPDEAGHLGNLKEKILAIERIDEYVIGPLYEYLKTSGDYRIWVTPDHYTPVEKRIHVNHPVPFAICGQGIRPCGVTFSEKNAETSELIFNDGYKLMPYFLDRS